MFLKLTLLELLIKGIPEGLLDILGIHVISKSPVSMKNYFLSSALFIVATYLIRLLPINFGVHTVLIVCTLILLTVTINKVELSKAVKSAFIVTVFLLIAEVINFLILRVCFGEPRVAEILTDKMQKCIYSIPSTVVFGILILIWYLFSRNRKAA